MPVGFNAAEEGSVWMPCPIREFELVLSYDLFYSMKNCHHIV